MKIFPYSRVLQCYERGSKKFVVVQFFGWFNRPLGTQTAVCMHFSTFWHWRPDNEPCGLDWDTTLNRAWEQHRASQ